MFISLYFMKFRIMKIIFIGISVLLTSFVFSQDKEVVLNNEEHIKLATHFLPENDKAEARVLGYDGNGDIKVLRESDSYLTCVADDPKKKGVQFVCYYTQLERFMQRGRDLKKGGKSIMEVREIRKKEIESGELKFPKGQSMMYVFNGKVENINVNAGTVEEGTLRYVVYVPYGTQSSTGLPLSPSAPGMPWLMEPGTHRAHIMISPK